MKKLTINKKRLRKLEPTTNAFQSLTRSIIYQQLSGKAAGTIFTRFTKLWPACSRPARPSLEAGRPTGRAGRPRKKFPTPKDVIAMSDEKLRSVGLSRSKTAYIKDLAARFLDGTITPKEFPKMSDEEIIEHLVRVKGVGVWTAHMFLIFALNRPDVLPTGDLAIRKGFQKAFKLRSIPTEKKMHEIAMLHAGERSYLALHLWAIMDGEVDI